MKKDMKKEALREWMRGSMKKYGSRLKPKGEESHEKDEDDEEKKKKAALSIHIMG